MKNTTLKSKISAGFSLVELLVVIAVIGVIAAIAIPNIGNITDAAGKSSKQRNAQNIASVYSAATAAGAVSGTQTKAGAIKTLTTDGFVGPAGGAFAGQTFKVKMDPTAATDATPYLDSTLNYVSGGTEALTTITATP